MNGRGPAYRKCNEVTLINPKTCEFKTFWKNVHQQFLITPGQVYGLTFEVKDRILVEDKDEGNREYIKLRKDGWIKWEDFCKEKGCMCLYYDFGRILF